MVFHAKAKICLHELAHDVSWKFVHNVWVGTEEPFSRSKIFSTHHVVISVLYVPFREDASTGRQRPATFCSEGINVVDNDFRAVDPKSRDVLSILEGAMHSDALSGS